jgi:biotin operon repressor
MPIQELPAIIMLAITGVMLGLTLMVLRRGMRLIREGEEVLRLVRVIEEGVGSRLSRLEERVSEIDIRQDIMEVQVKRLLTGARVPEVGVRRVVRPSREISSQVGEGERPVGRSSTEQELLRLLAEGPRTAPEIKELLGKSREHTARLLKKLYDEGLVIRDEAAKPYLYRLSDKGRSLLK